jgi:dimethylaniline monooxygenase (N-oxide forming)
MDLIAVDELIHIHRASITSMSECKITLSNEGTLDSDAVVFATGWKLNQPTFFPTPLLPDLGLPCKISEQHPATQNHWSALDAASETQVCSLFPMLASPPAEIVEYDKAHTREVTTTPFRLFRNMVPPTLAVKDERDIIFLGTLINTALPTYAEISSLWGIAYLEHLPFAPTTTNLLSSLEEMEKEISLLNNFGWLRFRDKSANYLDGSIEIQSFMDLLVRDLGLETRRKKKKQRGCFGMKGWWSEWFKPYVGEDYRGLVAEYLEKWKLGDQSKKA